MIRKTIHKHGKQSKNQNELKQCYNCRYWVYGQLSYYCLKCFYNLFDTITQCDLQNTSVFGHKAYANYIRQISNKKFHKLIPAAQIIVL